MLLWPKGGLQCYSFGVIAGHKVLKALHHELIWTHMDSYGLTYLIFSVQRNKRSKQTASNRFLCWSFGKFWGDCTVPYSEAEHEARQNMRGPSRHDERIVIVLNTLLCSPMLFYYSGWWLSNQNLTCEFLSSMPQVRKLFAPRGVSCCMLPESGHGLLMEDLNVWSRLCIIPSWMYNFAKSGSLCIASRVTRVRMRSKWAIMQLLGSASATELASVSSCRMWTNMNNRSMDLVCQLLAMSASLCIWSLSLRHVPRIWRIPRGKAAWITGGVLELFFSKLFRIFGPETFRTCPDHKPTCLLALRCILRLQANPVASQV